MLRIRRVLLSLGGLACATGVFLLAAAPSPPQEEPEYVGSAFCAECHVDAWEEFDGSVHDLVYRLLFYLFCHCFLQ